MDFRRSALEAQARRKARRERDDGSARLLACVPNLAELALEISVSQGGAPVQAARHVKRFVVQQAPALFVIECTDPACRDGGHDVTAEVLKGLTAGKERFVVDHECRGQAAERPCQRTLHVTAIARYAEAREDRDEYIGKPATLAPRPAVRSVQRRRRV